MKKKQALKGAKDFGVKLKVNKGLDKLSGKVLFPEQLKQADNILTNMKFTHVEQ
jgi:hypothetical protein